MMAAADKIRRNGRDEEGEFFFVNLLEVVIFAKWN